MPLKAAGHIVKVPEKPREYPVIAHAAKGTPGKRRGNFYLNPKLLCLHLG